MTEILRVLDARMERPGMYGVFHLTAFALMIVIAALLCAKGRNAKDKTFRKICVIFWIILFLFETYKQINFSFNYNDGSPYWDYQWYAFPFQSCSAALYVLPLVFLSKPDSALRKAAASYLAFYSLFGGIAVMLYPSTVFITVIGINIQTMVWHGSQVIIGIYFIAYYRKQLGLRFFAAGIPVFVGLVGVAMALNMIVPSFTDETFNMFYVSPKFESTLPLLDMVWKNTPWPVFFIIYLFGFTLAAFLVYLAAKGVLRLSGKKKAASEEQAA